MDLLPPHVIMEEYVMAREAIRRHGPVAATSHQGGGTSWLKTLVDVMDLLPPHIGKVVYIMLSGRRYFLSYSYKINNI